ncbi:hypothetical protein CcaverHIS002_0701150 [Cutaneotrichosporon cavernicola]|uniref:Uncharacterized protein n=1 Tax=Cutaneotrichosporon cavernicola TaxID=279322 RepID=A0AA48QYD1_9TREE|nr:uncharacterized protein CcaverHIS019_0701160 [Cutaneotrichosporon cavernicola]BEI86769.1 hypothetical protein CcaverHIS002_0701150 [Cutaneotrichosporon cavernicola]BEI94544.1 hypothetical protein CcaverHIS019_0701160 [Cutaneotrichosporon cavernicola]BEJ02320.1 hypothetical protein CcaverHIS631_0701150 [Cutaneotrichosporon cavernicola]BEJ10079.1 hypothetical protein CcaverHIS641_0701140 [Cutaneotrichosporon cavernicola]
MNRPTRRAMSVSAAHALHFQIPKMATPTPPSLLKRQLSQSSTSPRLMSPRPSSPATRSPPPVARSPPRPAGRDTQRPASPLVSESLRIPVNEYEATFGAARTVTAASN